MNKLKTTSLNDVHKHLGARMVPFAGWEMPVQYEGIIAESNAVRKKSGIFDVSHMGRVLFSGSDASNLLDSVLSVQVTDMKIGQARYTVICNSDGFIIDLLLHCKDTLNASVINNLAISLPVTYMFPYTDLLIPFLD